MITTNHSDVWAYVKSLVNGDLECIDRLPDLTCPTEQGYHPCVRWIAAGMADLAFADDRDGQSRRLSFMRVDKRAADLYGLDPQVDRAVLATYRQNPVMIGVNRLNFAAAILQAGADQHQPRLSVLVVPLNCQGAVAVVSVRLDGPAVAWRLRFSGDLDDSCIDQLFSEAADLSAIRKSDPMSPLQAVGLRPSFRHFFAQTLGDLGSELSRSIRP